MPSKIFDSLAIEKPTMLGVSGEAPELTEKCKSGLLFEPGDKVAFLEGIRRMNSDRELYTQCQCQCQRRERSLAMDYGRHKLGDKMLTELRSLEDLEG